MSNVLVLQHAEPETPGIIAAALAEHGIDIHTIRTYAGDAVPDSLAPYAGLLVMGGPMGVYEQDIYPHLTAELRLITEAVRAEKPILGICLGSQLLAAALGAPVAPGPAKEIGWHPVTLASDAATDPLFTGLPATFTAFHWHGDAYPLPLGTVPLASSAITPCQAFRYGYNAYGLLFHLEVTAGMVRDMVTTFEDEVTAAGLDGAAILAGIPIHHPPLQQIGYTVFHRWAAMIGQ